MDIQNKKPFTLSGPIMYRMMNIVLLLWATISTGLKRFLRIAQVPGWSLSFEISNSFLRMQNKYSFFMKSIEDGRTFSNSLVFYSPALNELSTQSIKDPIEGTWFYPKSPSRNKAILYFHGGGYAYYAHAHLRFIANIANSTDLPIFALDYPLIPEHSFPAQLEYAQNAYEWLIKKDYLASNLVLMGDSAGGNLCLTLLLKLKMLDLPLPSSVVAICPWTDVANSGESMQANEAFDWVESQMPAKWADWFLGGRSTDDPLISPIHGDFRNLPPIYIQAGGREILLDMIRDFYRRATEQGSNVEFDVWDSMTHDFQAYGDELKESREALRRISEFIHSKMDAA